MPLNRPTRPPKTVLCPRSYIVGGLGDGAVRDARPRASEEGMVETGMVETGMVEADAASARVAEETRRVPRRNV
jgi:hypothetical protein